MREPCYVGHVRRKVGRTAICSTSSRTGTPTRLAAARRIRYEMQMEFNLGQENAANIDIYYKGWGSGQSVVFSHGCR
jgi:hypothetical protein